MGMDYLEVDLIRMNKESIVMNTMAGNQRFDCDQAYTVESVLNTQTIHNVEEIYFRYTVKRTGTESHIEGGLTVAAAPVETVTIEISTDGKNYTNQGSITAKAGRWVGVKSGVYASHENTIKKSSDKCGFVTVDYVRYSN